MQVRPWGPSITPQAHHFNGDSGVEAKLKYDPLFQNSKITKTSILQKLQDYKWRRLYSYLYNGMSNKLIMIIHYFPRI